MEQLVAVVITVIMAVIVIIVLSSTDIPPTHLVKPKLEMIFQLVIPNCTLFPTILMKRLIRGNALIQPATIPLTSAIIIMLTPDSDLIPLRQ